MCPFSKNANEVKTLNVGKFQFQIPSVICMFFSDRKVVTSPALRWTSSHVKLSSLFLKRIKYLHLFDTCCQ